MTVNSIMDLARELSHVTTQQFDNAKVIVYLNMIYSRVGRLMKSRLDEKHFISTQEDDAVADQDSYSLQADFARLKEISILPTSDSVEYRKTREIDFNSLSKPISWYLTNQSFSDPLHMIINKTLRIFPRFTVDTAGPAGNDQIRYRYVYTFTDLTVGGAENTILIDKETHDVLSIGIKQYIYDAQGKTALAKEARAEFNNDLALMLNTIGERDDTNMEATMPDASNLE